MDKTITIGAVAYDPRVVPIWDGMREYFREVGPAIDYVLFSNYDRQVQALLDRHIDIAWNTNLAWVKVHQRTGGACGALAMRDADAVFSSLFVTRAGSGIRALADLKGMRVALGSADSAQAAILPLHFLKQAGINPERDCRLTRFDLDVGKHGDTGTSELEVLKALANGAVDAGALGDGTWNNQVAKGKVEAHIQPFWTSPAYCHCNFTVLADFPEDLGHRWTESLLAMSYDNPRWRPLMDMEGLKRWVLADAKTMKGYDVIFEAVKSQRG